MPEVDSEGVRYSADRPQQAPGFFLKGSHQLDWGMKNRLARTFNPSFENEETDVERLNKIRQFDPLLWRMHVEAGVTTLADFLSRYRGSDHLTYAHPGAGTMPHPTPVHCGARLSHRGLSSSPQR